MCNFYVFFSLKVSMKLFIFALIFGFVAFATSQQYDKYHHKTRGYPWPMPMNMTSDSSKMCQVSEELVFDFGSLASCDLMQAAEDRSFRYIFGRNRIFSRVFKRLLSQRTGLSMVQVALNSGSKTMPAECQTDHFPTEDMDESYEVMVECSTTPMAKVTANSVWGLIRGLETFSQLTYMDENGMKMINETTISDRPAFAWRGLMLDTSRHFLPMSILIENLDIMATNKFNVFHWHLVDDQSFPWFSETYPQLSQAGAYRPVSLHSYTPSDVQAVIRHGRLLGVRVVPEFDTPGHTQSWGSGLPDIVTACYDAKGNPTGTFGPLDPSSPTIWQEISGIFSEVYRVFPDNYMHLGGDEVSYEFGCWLSNPRIKTLMKMLNITTGAQLQSYYTQQQLKVLESVTKDMGRYVYWEEVFDSNITLPKDRAIVHVWKTNQSTLGNITKAGLHGLFSQCWYLDHLNGNADWPGYYNCDPLAFNATNPDQKKLVMGGEACMWGEYVDPTNVLQRVWPRASAIGERLWSDPRSKSEIDVVSGLPKALTVDDMPDVQLRLEEHRCRMVGRGFPAQPVIGPGFCDVEYRSM